MARHYSQFHCGYLGTFWKGGQLYQLYCSTSGQIQLSYFFVSWWSALHCKSTTATTARWAQREKTQILPRDALSSVLKDEQKKSQLKKQFAYIKVSVKYDKVSVAVYVFGE